jgi:hypothetical protein
MELENGCHVPSSRIQRTHSVKAEDFAFCIARFEQAIRVESKAITGGKPKCSPDRGSRAIGLRGFFTFAVSG